MSSGLVKQRIMIVPKTAEKRIIDSNERLKQLLGGIDERNGSGGQGFVAGLAAEVLEVSGQEDGGEGNVIKAHEEDPGEILEQAKSEAQAILAQAQMDALKIRSEAEEQANIGKAQVFQQARQEGYEEGYACAMAEGEALKQQLLEKGQELENSYQQLIDTLEPQFVDTITDIYEHIFQVDLSAERGILAYLISSTLRKQEGGHEFIIHVSKEDYSYVSMQKRQILAGAVSASCNVDVVEDLTLGKNECMIETENGIFDCGLGTQLAELKNRLMLLAWSKEE